MPIRINLLAEAQALEDQRRRDPVKRAVWVGAALVLGVLAWSSSLQLKAMIAKGELSRIEAQVAARKTEYEAVLASQRKLADFNAKLAALQQLATNRLLYGTLLNALQQTIVDDVQLTRFRAEQSYAIVDEIKPKTNANNRITPGRPAAVSERVQLTLEAKDSAAAPGDQVPHFKRRISDLPYFQEMLGKTNEIRLANLTPPQMSGDKPFVLFTLDCRFPEKTR
jgi:hypothetical protein